jgi:hypothetical protein
MRKFMLAGVIAVLGTALLASPAFAFDHHFSVLGKQKSSHRVGHGFQFKDKLLNPKDRSDRVGRDRGRCRAKHQALKCRAVAHLNGKIGGFGDIRVRGDLRRNDNRLNVVGGSGAFDGVAGKVLIHSVGERTDKLHFDLTR